mmetsp:Transcript_69608/g.163479  ORF Transcript_69608/g.163479 Transcript_69608/m.163479 type:complete len:203 (+) Transcript_69608:607-1215(+)
MRAKNRFSTAGRTTDAISPGMFRQKPWASRFVSSHSCRKKPAERPWAMILLFSRVRSSSGSTSWANSFSSSASECSDSFCKRNMTWSARLNSAGQAWPTLESSLDKSDTLPKKKSLPEWSSMTLSKRWKTSEDGWWMVQSTLQPSLKASNLNFWMTVCAANESSPVVGSSRKMSLGCTISSIATQVRFFSPPEMPLMRSSPM